MNQAIIDGRTWQVPGKFNELSAAQYLGVVGLLHTEMPKLELKLRLTLVLLEANRRPLLYRQLHRMSDVQRHNLTELAGFLFREPRFTKQLLPRLKLPGQFRPTVLHGPGDALADVTFAEFIEAEGHFAAYHADPQPRHLAVLVATLYRTDRAQAYSPAVAAARLASAALLPHETLLAVRLWYASCRASWARKYNGTVFSAPDQAGEATPQNPRDTWRDILAERAGSPLHYDEYGQLLLPNIFFDLDQRIRRRQAEAAALEAGRRN